MRDLRYENWFEREGLGEEGPLWEYVPDVALERIDRQGSEQNYGRLTNKLDPELVAHYALAMQEGAEFPALVVNEGPEGLLIKTGRHRVAAADQIGRNNFDMYILKTDDPWILDRIAVAANTIEGRGEHGAIALEKALGLYHRHPDREIKLIAATCGIGAGRLGDAIAAKKGELRIKAVQPKLARNLPSTILTTLQSLGDDRAFKRAAEVASAGGMTGDQVRSMVAEMRKRPTAEGQIGVANRLANSPTMLAQVAETRGGTVRRRGTSRSGLLRRLESVRELVDAASPDELRREIEADRPRVALIILDFMPKLFALVQEVSHGQPSGEVAQPGRRRPVA